MTQGPDERYLRRIRYVSREAWEWAKTQAVREGRTVGELLNGLIQEYRDEVRRHEGRLPRRFFRDYSHDAISVRGLEPRFWDWLKARADVEKQVAGRLLSELIGRYQRRVSAWESLGPRPPCAGTGGEADD